MKKRLSHFICCLLTSCIVLSETCTQAATYQPTVQSVSTQAESTITVSDFDEFSAALGNKHSHIIIDTNFALTLDDEPITKQTIPLDIPGETTIEGKTSDIEITSRGPIQITGDNVTIKNLKLKFTSTNALGAIPQREIFLAGHSLTLDNVDTYLEGGKDSGFGDITGTEAELLPTIYGGGFHTNNNIGSNASLTVNRADKNGKTPIFQDIIIGNNEQSGKYTEYKGKAELSLDAYTQVRGEVSTKLNSEATISVTGTASDKIQKIPSITGNTNTTLNISGCNITKDTSVNGMGTININNNGTFTPTASTVLNNISVEGDSCLDLTDMSNANINGDFSGGTDDKKADIIVGLDGRIILNKTASGSSQLYITNRQPSCTDIPSTGWSYITVNNDNSQADFNFAQKYIDNGYRLINNDNTWTCHYEEPDEIIASKAEITDCPKDIYINNITSKINDDSPSMHITWKDASGKPLDAYDAFAGDYYNYTTFILTDYWYNNTVDIDQKTDGFNPICLEYDNMYSNKFYLIHDNVNEQIKSGKYTLLLFSESIEDKTLVTVSDVKALKSLVIGSIDINFTDTKTEPTAEPTTEPTATPTAKPTATPTAKPTATPTAEPTATPTAEPTATPTAEPTATPTAEPTATPTAEPTATPTAEPTATPTAEPTATPTAEPTATPTAEPTATPTAEPTATPTAKPTAVPTVTPTAVPTAKPTAAPTPTAAPAPSVTPEPTPVPTTAPTAAPTAKPTDTPTTIPTAEPISTPTAAPSTVPTKQPSNGSSGSGSNSSSSGNNTTATTRPTTPPTVRPTLAPTAIPTNVPTVTPAVTSAPPTTVPTASAKPDITPAPTNSSPTTKPDVTQKPTAEPAAPTSSPTATPAHKHKITQVVKKATTKKSGSITYICKTCNKVIKKTTIPALKKTSITKSKAGKNSFTITFKKQTNNTNGYQISYSTKKNLSDDKKKTVANSNKSTATISGLKSNKKYYIRIRTYKDVKVNGKTVRMYGECSEKEAITTK